MNSGKTLIEVSQQFSIAPQDAKLEGASPQANVQNIPPPPKDSIVLRAFQGTYKGHGFNTIFRPEGTGAFHTTFTTPPVGPNDNVLELNLTSETLSFSPSSALGNVPNRGFGTQSDITLVGVPYVQQINDSTDTKNGTGDLPPGPDNGLHFEPGLWMVVPATGQDPIEAQTLNRMGSIPHGTTINAQGLEPTSKTAGAPKIPPVDITPITIVAAGTKPTSIPFPSQMAAQSNTSRLPQDLTKFIQAGTITQAILTDPNTVLRNFLQGQTIVDTTTFVVTTDPTDPNNAPFGGGTQNASFLVGEKGDTANAPNANADAVRMTATFWVETVSWKVTIPPSKKGTPLTLTPHAPNLNVVLPTFSVTTPKDITAAFDINVTSTQIQYSQLVFLNFNNLSWPHASVATLTRADTIPIDPSLLG